MHPFEIIPGKVYLGTLSHVNSADSLRMFGITHVLSLVNVEAPVGISNVCHLVKPIDDSNTQDIVENNFLNDAILWVKRAIDEGGAVFVHCLVGISRSATVVLAYLVKHHNMALKDAYHHVIQRRPIIDPNPSFWKQLCRFLDHPHPVPFARTETYRERFRFLLKTGQELEFMVDHMKNFNHQTEFPMIGIFVAAFEEVAVIPRHFSKFVDLTKHLIDRKLLSTADVYLFLITFLDVRYMIISCFAICV
ncbi:protein-tyrosine phosphatase-like protein [Paraphysoderma sedebokerense]|nr:protein-tyrosine phosphatase-like protein [Paraphysoderma sedebokerense]